MNKTLKSVIIIFGALSILFAIYGLIQGAELIEASGGITIGALLIAGAILYDKQK